MTASTGGYPGSTLINDNYLSIDGKSVLYLSEKNPANLPWKQLDIDFVIESTGLFTRREDAEKHILSGAKTVVIFSFIKLRKPF
ncbi:MAG: glyceraldehyde 3-phosphate dehydrogenase NAD-binding domain-containing protein [Ferruginibacter sp.]